MKKYLLLLLFIPLVNCSDDDDSQFVTEKLSSLTNDEDMFYAQPSNQILSQPSECVYYYFQDGFVYNERCNREFNTYCIQDWYRGFSLNEISIVSEDENNLVFIHNNETYEIRYNSSNESVQLFYNSSPDYQFITTKISEEQLNDYLDDDLNLPNCD